MNWEPLEAKRSRRLGQQKAVKVAEAFQRGGFNAREWKSKKTITDKYLEVISGLRKSTVGREGWFEWTQATPKNFYLSTWWRQESTVFLRLEGQLQDFPHSEAYFQNFNFLEIRMCFIIVVYKCSVQMWSLFFFFFPRKAVLKSTVFLHSFFFFFFASSRAIKIYFDKRKMKTCCLPGAQNFKN